MLKEFTPRLYQETILASCAHQNTLVVLPTGMGKTAIALMLAVQRLTTYPKSKVLILAPTKPLVEQHKKTFSKHLSLDDSQLTVFTGNINPEKRGELWKNTKIAFSTPQGLENDIISNRINLSEVSLLVVDEAHRAVSNYAYCFIAKQYDRLARYPLILALTASPGANKEKIDEVCNNLFIEGVEVRSADDNDVKQYIRKVNMTWIDVQLTPEILAIKKCFDDCYKTKLVELKNLGVLNSIRQISKTDILKLQAGLQARVSRGEKDMSIWRSLSVGAEALKIQHALELLETQGLKPLLTYLERFVQQADTTKIKAVQNLVRDENFRRGLVKTRSAIEREVEHPKVKAVITKVTALLKKNPKQRIMLFNNYRDNAKRLKDEFDKITGIEPKLFVGQAKKAGSGMSQKEQKAMLESFGKNEFNLLICTSIGEEGLDIPKVDYVIFYEPIPSAIRYIQRKGRTGRTEKGAVIIFCTKNTRDEYYKWSAIHKERRMNKILREFKSSFVREKQQSLETFKTETPIRILADYREKSSGAIKSFMDMGIKVSLQQLSVGDYILSERVGVELKKVPDFVNSIVDGRLLEQIRSLSISFEKPLLIIEGDEDIYNQRNLHPNSIRGMIATIMVNYGIPLFKTKNSVETAELLAVIARREQSEGHRLYAQHTKKPSSIKEQQEFLISALPNIGPALAKDLLSFFNTPNNVMNASKDQLKKVEGVGDKIADSIRSVIDLPYMD